MKKLENTPLTPFALLILPVAMSLAIASPMSVLMTGLTSALISVLMPSEAQAVRIFEPPLPQNAHKDFEKQMNEHTRAQSEERIRMRYLRFGKFIFDAPINQMITDQGHIEMLLVGASISSRCQADGESITENAFFKAYTATGRRVEKVVVSLPEQNGNAGRADFRLLTVVFSGSFSNGNSGQITVLCPRPQ